MYQLHGNTSKKCFSLGWPTLPSLEPVCLKNSMQCLSRCWTMSVSCHSAPEMAYPQRDYITQLQKSETQIQAGCGVYEENNINYLSQLWFCLILVTHCYSNQQKRKNIPSQRPEALKINKCWLFAHKQSISCLKTSHIKIPRTYKTAGFMPGVFIIKAKAHSC